MCTCICTLSRGREKKGREGGKGRERERDRERERECKIPLYNPDSQSYLDEINPQSTQLTQFTLYATRQLSSLAWASLEPMPFGIVASIDAS